MNVIHMLSEPVLYIFIDNLDKANLEDQGHSPTAYHQKHLSRSTH